MAALRPAHVEVYQSSQKWKKRFPEGCSLAAFVVGPERETLFVGMYDVLKFSRMNGPLEDPLLGPMPSEDRSLHELKHSDRMQEYEEKLVVEWGPGKLAWRQRAHEQNKMVLEIRAKGKELPFPQYHCSPTFPGGYTQYFDATATHLDNRAEECRALAAAVTDGDCRAKLLRLAETYQNVSDRIGTSP